MFFCCLNRSFCFCGFFGCFILFSSFKDRMVGGVFIVRYTWEKDGIERGFWSVVKVVGFSGVRKF